MLDGAPVQVRTLIRLKELVIRHLWGSKETFLPASMEATIEFMPFGHEMQKNPEMVLRIPIPEDMRKHLEKILLLELEKFIQKANER